MKSNAGKCHLLVSTNANVALKISNFDINNTRCKKLLEVRFDQKTEIQLSYFRSMQKTNRKIHTLARAKEVPFDERFFTSQFNYCPVV